MNKNTYKITTNSNILAPKSTYIYKIALDKKAPKKATFAQANHEIEKDLPFYGKWIIATSTCKCVFDKTAAVSEVSEIITTTTVYGVYESRQEALNNI